MTMKRIVLDPEDRERGYSILLFAGTIVYTDIRGTYIVDEDEGGIQKLRDAGVRFDIVAHVPNRKD